MSGMGLLSANASGGDPYAGILGGLSDASESADKQTEKEREEQLRREIMSYLAGDKQTAGDQIGPDISEVSDQQMQLGTTRPQGLLGGPSATTVQARPQALPSATPEEIAAAEGGEGLLAGNGPLPFPGTEGAGVPGGLLTEPAGQGAPMGPPMTEPNLPQDVAQLFGLLAQYGDPEKAAQGFVRYQTDQQRIAATSQASQARSSGFNIIWDKDGNGWFPHRNAETGQSELNPALDGSGKQIERDPMMQLLEIGGGVTGIGTRGAGAGGAQQVVSPLSAAIGEDVKTLYADKAAAIKKLPRLEDRIAEGIRYVDELTGHPGTGFMTNPYTGWLGDIAANVPILGAATGASDWKLRQQQLKSQAFINAIGSIKEDAGGIGPISDKESAALTMSLIRAESVLNFEDFTKAMADIRRSLELMVREGRRKAGYDDATPSTERGVDFRTADQKKKQKNMTDSAQEAAVTDTVDALVEKYATGPE